ncbi:MAG: hypothetical protein ACLQNE_42430 [Thermoguttaceae bacterium]
MADEVAQDAHVVGRETVNGAAVRASFGMHEAQKGLVLPITVDGMDYPFLVDTGFSRTLFDYDLNLNLGKVISEQSISKGAVKRITVHDGTPSLRLGPVALASAPQARCADLTRIRLVSGRDFYGILGLDYLRGRILDIDFDEERVCVLGGLPPLRGGGLGNAIALERDRVGKLWIKARTGRNIQTRFVVDTGCSGNGRLDESLIRRLTESGEFREVGRVRDIGVRSDEDVTEGRLATFSVGVFQHQDLTFAAGECNLLGIGYLSRYRIVLDLGRDTMYLRRGKRFSQQDRPPNGGSPLEAKCLVKSTAQYRQGTAEVRSTRGICREAPPR